MSPRTSSPSTVRRVTGADCALRGCTAALAFRYSSREGAMRFLMRISWDVEAGNAIVRSGKLGQVVQSILAEQKPEAAYFTAEGGQRGGIIVVNVSDASQIPALAEPWFLTANAKVEFIPAMTPEDLAKAGPSIEAAIKKYV